MMPDGAVRRRPNDPDRLASLEEERRFLLRSLADLEREYQAGDVDAVDYRELKDGYTVRAAATLRAIAEGHAALPAKPPVNWMRRASTVVVLGALVAVVWWALSASSAQRLPGQEISGANPASDQQLLLAQARSVQATQPGAAAALYERVLEIQPDNVEALAYRGWTLALSMAGVDDAEIIQATLRESADLLNEAITLDPTYPDPHCFLGIVQGRFLGQTDAALPYLDTCLAGNPPADIQLLVQDFRDRLSS